MKYTITSMSILATMSLILLALTFIESEGLAYGSTDDKEDKTDQKNKINQLKEKAEKL